MNTNYITFILILCPLFIILPQQEVKHPDAVNYPVYMDQSPPLRDIKPIAPNNELWENNEVPNQVRPNFNPNTIKNENFRDPVVQNKFGTLKTTATITSFDGDSNHCGCYPPDINMDVGPNHIVQTVNTEYEVWDKNGNILKTRTSLSDLWQDTGPGPWVGTNSGDPIVLYDQFADRWLISQFSIPSSAGPFYELIAVSTSPDPLGTYNRYIYTFINLPDYPKLGVWRDGYYLSTNNFVPPSFASWAGTSACVMERDSMLAGKTARIVVFNTTSSDTAWSLLPSDADGKILPPVGAPNYFIMHIDQADWGGTGPDRLSCRPLHVDWSNILNSTYGPVISLQVAPFDDNMCNYLRNCIPQSGTSVKLDAISDRLLHRLQYRNFGSYQSIVCNHTVDVGSDHAGVRWYELRNTGSGWTVYQQSTYSPDATHRWMGSIAMDGDGNIAVGFSNSSSTMFPAIKYTGRFSTDALNSFTLAEQSIIDGGGSQTGSVGRWGDYSMLTVDPFDDATFWYTNEYYAATSSVSWRTRIASFKISSLAISAPIGGEFWTNGSVHNITWNAVGVSNVKLEYSTDNGANWNNIIASTSAAAGSFSWTLPSLSYDLVKVRVTDLANTSQTSQSSNYFSVANNSTTMTPATGSGSSTTFTGTGITFNGNISVSGPIIVNYFSAHIAAGALPSGVKVVSPYFWTLFAPAIVFSNGKMIVPLSFLSGVNNSAALVWLKRSSKALPWTNIGGTINGSNLESNVAFSSFSEFAIGSIDSTNFGSIVTLTALIQGLYNGSSMVSDTITLELRNNVSPFPLVESHKGILNSSGIGTFVFTSVTNGTPYYLVIKHRNGIETWSAASNSFTSSALNYDFTTAQNQAFGNNLILKGTKWCIYSGDVNHDGLVDSGDLAAVDNDNASYTSGYTNTDVNGDGIVDSSDLAITDNNNANYIGKIIPLNSPSTIRISMPIRIN